MYLMIVGCVAVHFYTIMLCVFNVFTRLAR